MYTCDFVYGVFCICMWASVWKWFSPSTIYLYFGHIFWWKQLYEYILDVFFFFIWVLDWRFQLFEDVLKSKKKCKAASTWQWLSWVEVQKNDCMYVSYVLALNIDSWDLCCSPANVSLDCKYGTKMETDMPVGLFALFSFLQLGKKARNDRKRSNGNLMIQVFLSLERKCCTFTLLCQIICFRLDLFVPCIFFSSVAIVIHVLQMPLTYCHYNFLFARQKKPCLHPWKLHSPTEVSLSKALHLHNCSGWLGLRSEHLSAHAT